MSLSFTSLFSFLLFVNLDPVDKSVMVMMMMMMKIKKKYAFLRMGWWVDMNSVVGK